MKWRRKWQKPTPIFLPGESHGWRSLAGYSPSKAHFNYCCSLTKRCLTLCDSMDWSTQGPLSTISRVCSNSCPLSWWCYRTISSFVAPLSSFPQSFPALGSFPVSQLFTSGGQSIGASASVLLMDIQVWFPLGLTGLILCRPRDSKESFPALQLESISSLALSLLYGPTFTSEYDYWKNHSLTIWTFVSKAMSLFIKCCLGLS